RRDSHAPHALLALVSLLTRTFSSTRIGPAGRFRCVDFWDKNSREHSRFHRLGGAWSRVFCFDQLDHWRTAGEHRDGKWLDELYPDAHVYSVRGILLLRAFPRMAPRAH